MRTRISLVFLLCVISASSIAADTTSFHTAIGLAIVNNDNIFLSNTNKQEENIFHTLFDLNYKKNTSAIEANLDLHIDHQIYQKKSFSDQTVINSKLDLNAILSKNRLAWNVMNSTDRVRLDTSRPDIPTNQVDTNYFETGPRLTVFNDRKQSIDMLFQYQKFHAGGDIVNVDSSAYFTRALYKRNVTRTFLAGIDAIYRDKKYDDDVSNTNYKRTDVSILLNKRTKLSNVELNIGRTRVSPQGQEDIERNRIQASFNRRLGYHYQMAIDYERMLGDFGDLVAARAAGGVIIAGIGSRFFVNEKRGIRINRNVGKSDIIYEYTYYSTEYLSDATQDQTLNMVRIGYANSLSQKIKFNLGVSYSVNDFALNDRRDLNRTFLAGITRSIKDRYNINFSIKYINVGSNVVASSYNDRVLTLSGVYFIN